MIRGPSQARRRTYDNRLREQQAEGTKERILEALMGLLGDEGMGAFSVGRVAKLAGVSEPTIYRHFGSREGLIEAWSRWFEKRGGHPGYPKSLDEALAAPPRLFRYFSDNAELIRASQTAEAHDLIGPGRARRRRAMAELVKPLTSKLPPGEAEAILQVFAVLMSSQTWKTICDDNGVPPEQAGRAVERTLRALVADLRTT